MAGRTVAYTFTANILGLTAGLTAAGRSVADLGTKLTAADRNGVKMRAGLTSIGSTAGKVGLVAAAGFAVAVAAAANFEQAMSNVAAATHETAGNMELLRKAAIEAGQATKFSATEAAAGIEELAKAGVSTTDILDGGLSGALDLAAAGGLEVADAAQIAATALTQFRLAGEDVPHVADLLAAGAGKAQGDVSDLSMALKQSGLVASQMGLSIEETTGTLAAFASAGLLGSDAGTSFRTMLLRLANPTQESAALMEQLGIAAYDAQGNLVGIESLSGQLATAFQGQTQAQRDAALATLFGSDAIRAANVLYNQGATGIADWTDKVNDQGYAAETAAIKMDNLSGDLEQLKGSLETALIGAGDGSQGPLRTLVQGITDAVNAFNKLPPAAQGTATALLGITAVTGGGLWFGSKVINGIADTRAALELLGPSGVKAGKALSFAGRAAGVAGVAFAGLLIIDQLQNKFDGATVGIEGMTKALLEVPDGGTLPEDLDGLADSIDRLADPNKAQAFQDSIAGVIGFGGGSEWGNAKSDIEAIDAALSNIVAANGVEAAAEAFDSLAATAGLSKGEIEDLRSLLPGYEDAIAGAANETKIATGATEDYGVAARQAATFAQAEADALIAATKAMRDKTSATLAAFDAETGYRQALKDAQAQAKKNNAGIKGNTDAALANRSALSGLASAWNNQSAAVKNNVDRYKDARKSFLDAAEAMGVTARDAKNLADRILEIPKSHVTDVTVDGVDAATQKVRYFKSLIDSLHSKTIAIDVATGQRRAAGGPIYGPGTKTSDSVPVMASRGEFMMSAAAVDHYGLDAMFAMNARKLASGGSVSGAGGKAGVAPGLPWLVGLNALGEKELRRRASIADREERLAEKSLERAKERLDEERGALKDLRDARRDFMQSVTSNFRSDVFGSDADLTEAALGGQLGPTFQQGLQAYLQASGAQLSPGMSREDQAALIQQYLATLSASQIAALQAQASVGTLGMDAQNAEAFERVLEQLRGLGLRGGAYQELAASGNLAQAQAYLQMGPEFVKTLMREFRQRDQALQNLGQSVGNAQFGADIREQLHVAHRAARIAEEARDELREIKAGQRAVARELAEIKRDSPTKTGDAVAGALNGAVGHGQRKG